MSLLQGLSVRIETMRLKTILLVIKPLLPTRDWRKDLCVCVRQITFLNFLFAHLLAAVSCEQLLKKKFFFKYAVVYFLVIY